MAFNGQDRRRVRDKQLLYRSPGNASEIAVRVGTSWIDKELYKEFFCELIGMPYYYRDGVELYYNKHDGSWRIDRTQYARNYGEMNVTSVYGTSRANAE